MGTKWDIVLFQPGVHKLHRTNGVGDLMFLGEAARTVLKAQTGLYFVIGLMNDDVGHYEDEGLDGTTEAVAYLVRETTGEIVCKQPLPHFYEGSILPINIDEAKVIKADEEGKTMCAIVYGSGLVNGTKVRDDYLFINTFTVKRLASFDSSEYDSEIGPVFGEFVSVDIKERYIYKADHKEDGLYRGFQACFM